MNALREKIIRNFTDCAAIENFRLGANGELNKREGYVTLGSFTSAIRGAVSVGDSIYTVSGKNFYQVSNGNVYKKGTLDGAVFSDSKEKVTMFTSSNLVFVLGGSGYYRYDIDADIFTAVNGYVPIIDTENYDDENIEKIKEPFNIFTNTVRMHFKFFSTLKSYKIPANAKQVTAVRLNGQLLSSSQYLLNNTPDQMEVIIDPNDVHEGEILEIEYIIKSSVFTADKSKITSCRKAFPVSADGVSVLFLYDSPNLSPGRIIYSKPPVSPTGSDGVFDYFINGREIIIGDGTKPIHAIARLGDRIIVITSDEVYSVNVSVLSGGDMRFYVSRLYSDFGASENSGCAVLDNSLYFANETGLFRLSFDSVSGTFKRSQIDIPAVAIGARNQYKDIKLHFDRRNSELWCCTDSEIGVYSIRYGTWYRFTGISGAFFFTSGSKTAFISNNRLNLFDESIYTDGGSGFDAFIESKNLSFDNVFTEKTVYGFGAAFERREGAALECILINDKGNTFSTVIESDGNGGTSPVVLHTHARLGKSAYIIYRLISPSYAAPANVREIMFRYRTTGV